MCRECAEGVHGVYAGGMCRGCTCRGCVQRVYTRSVYRGCTQGLCRVCAGTMCGGVCNSVCRRFVQRVCRGYTQGVCRRCVHRCVQGVYTVCEGVYGGVCRGYVQGVYTGCVQGECVHRCVQRVYTGLCKRRVQEVCAGDMCRSVHRLCVEIMCRGSVYRGVCRGCTQWVVADSGCKAASGQPRTFSWSSGVRAHLARLPHQIFDKLQTRGHAGVRGCLCADLSMCSKSQGTAAWPISGRCSVGGWLSPPTIQGGQQGGALSWTRELWELMALLVSATALRLWDTQRHI